MTVKLRQRELPERDLLTEEKGSRNARQKIIHRIRSRFYFDLLLSRGESRKSVMFISNAFAE